VNELNKVSVIIWKFPQNIALRKKLSPSACFRPAVKPEQVSANWGVKSLTFAHFAKISLFLPVTCEIWHSTN